MKIVYCIDSIGSGGVEQITVFKANALAEREGNRVWIVYTDPPKEGGVLHPSEKVGLVDLGIRYCDNHRRFPWNILLFALLERRHKKALAASLREINPDVVISTGGKEKTFLYAIKGNWVKLRELHVSKGARLQIAFSFRDRVVARLLEFAEFRGVLHKYDCLVVPTQYEKEDAWGNDRRVAVIPNPLRFSTAPPEDHPREKTIVAVGRLEPGKNYASLIRAFRSASDHFPEWTLHLCGEGSERRSLTALIRQLGLSRRVFLEGYVPRLEEVLRKAAFFVHPSRYETFGMVIVEAMAYGLPVIAYDCRYGPRTILEDGKDGFLVPVDDESLLAERICALMGNEALRSTMGREALAKAEQFDIRRVCPLWMDLFERLHEEKSK